MFSYETPLTELLFFLAPVLLICAWPAPQIIKGRGLKSLRLAVRPTTTTTTTISTATIFLIACIAITIATVRLSLVAPDVGEKTNVPRSMFSY